jgi:hypothetical protein
MNIYIELFTLHDENQLLTSRTQFSVASGNTSRKVSLSEPQTSTSVVDYLLHASEEDACSSSRTNNTMSSEAVPLGETEAQWMSPRTPRDTIHEVNRRVNDNGGVADPIKINVGSNGGPARKPSDETIRKVNDSIPKIVSPLGNAPTATTYSVPEDKKSPRYDLSDESTKQAILMNGNQQIVLARRFINDDIIVSKYGVSPGTRGSKSTNELKSKKKKKWWNKSDPSLTKTKKETKKQQLCTIL